MIWLFQTNTLSLRCVFHSIRFKVNNFGSQRRAFFYALIAILSSSLVSSKLALWIIGASIKGAILASTHN